MKAKLLKQILNRLNDYDDVFISNGDSLYEISSAIIGNFQNERVAMLAIAQRCKAVSYEKIDYECMAISDVNF